MKKEMYECDRCKKDITNSRRYRIEVSWAPPNDFYRYNETVSGKKSPIELCTDCYKAVKIVI